MVYSDFSNILLIIFSSVSSLSAFLLYETENMIVSCERLDPCLSVALVQYQYTDDFNHLNSSLLLVSCQKSIKFVWTISLDEILITFCQVMFYKVSLHGWVYRVKIIQNVKSLIVTKPYMHCGLLHRASFCSCNWISSCLCDLSIF